MDSNFNLIKLYIDQLDETELAILEIARKMLKSSFNIEKTIGFINWKNKNNNL